MKSWGIPTLDCCLLCGKAEETLEHLFFNCDFSRSLLSDISLATDGILWKICNLPLAGGDIRICDIMEAI